MDIDSLFEENKIDPDLSRWMLNKVRSLDRRTGSSNREIEFEGLPHFEGSGSFPMDDDNIQVSDRIIDIRDKAAIEVPVSKTLLMKRLTDFGLPEQILATVMKKIGADARLVLGYNELEIIGIAALPLVSYGILNGGSATSYADEKKNRKFNSSLFDLYKQIFDSQAEICKGRAKGLTPAYINPNGESGFSFIELKIRACLILANRHYKEFPESRDLQSTSWSAPLFPLFQMTSSGNDGEISREYDKYRLSQPIKELSDKLGIDACNFETGIQPLISAFTHSSNITGEREFFLKAGGKEDTPLALPGGHGQNFIALEKVYRTLETKGKKLAYLGNVDNMAYLPDPIEIALLMLSNAPAGFDFSFKTDVDVKGGVLLQEKGGKLSCGDIGVAIQPGQLRKAEKTGVPVLFNCATGLFNLHYLNKNLKSIQENLPLRVSDQDKDAGKYSQAEQVTWEILSLISGFIIFGVDKFDRFLASKLLVENLITSGISLDHPDFPEELHWIATKLRDGFYAVMNEKYSMELKSGSWIPRKDT